MDEIRIGIVGAGGNTRAKHIPGFRAIPGVSIAGVANRSLDSSRRVCDEFGIPEAYADWRELVETDKIDAVLIGTWPYMHAPVTIAALENGKHVLCEARMAMNAEEARRMYGTSLAHPGLTAQLVPAPFTLEVDRTVQRLIREGFTGELLSVEVVVTTGTFPDPGEELSWRRNDEYSGMNVLQLGIWYESLVRWIGPALNVSAVGKTAVKLRYDPETEKERAVLIPDHIRAVAEMACGAVGGFLFSSISAPERRSEITLYGKEGTILFSGGELFTVKRGETGYSPVKIPATERGGWRVEEEFVAAVRGTGTVRNTTFADGVKYMEFTEAVRRSIDEGRRISIRL